MTGCRTLLTVAAFFLVAVSGCSDVPSQSSSRSFGLIFANDVSAGCENTPIRTGKLPEDVAWLVARLLDADGVERASVVIQEEGLEVPGETLITGLPPGRYQLEVTGCSSDSEPEATWGGRSREFDVYESQKSAPIVFMMRSGATSCVGGKNQNPVAPQFDGDGFLTDGVSAFGAGAVTGDGRIFVSGGFDRWKPGATGDFLSAGNRVWEFDPHLGVFVGVFDGGDARLSMKAARAMHGLIESASGDGMLIAVGGISSAYLAPAGFPGDKAPIDGAEDVEFNLEVLNLQNGEAIGIDTPGAGTQPAWSVGPDRKWLALAGGRDAAHGNPSNHVVFLEGDSAELLNGSAMVMEGDLYSPRFASAARFLSTGELLLVGGWEGTQAAGPELVRQTDAGALESQPLAVTGPPPGISPTAFPSLVVLSDDGQKAQVLIAGGNPLDDPTFDYASPDPAKPTLWILDIESADGAHYDPASAKASALGDAPDWTVRSLATLVSVGESLLVAGGYRTFTEQPEADGCGLVWGSFCFPRILAEFSVEPLEARLNLGRLIEDQKSRLGALVLPLGPGRTLILGGMDGFGYPKQDRASNPPPPSTTPILSTGYVLLSDGYFDAAVCAANPPVAAE